ncbi:hypothetical protein F7725_007367, partial [Dissostichus mawsoni]
GEDLAKVIVRELGSLLLKLDCIFNVPGRCIDDIVEELQFITCSASAPVIKNIVHNTLVNHNCSVEELVITDLKCPEERAVHLTNKVEYQGTSYGIGMMLVYGSTGGLPDFAEILQIIIVRDSLVFVVKLQCAWYCERVRCFKLESTSTVKVIEQSQLTDIYPLATYAVEGNRMLSLKHHICLRN